MIWGRICCGGIMKPTEEEARELAAQLRKPDGELGLDVANKMNLSNKMMTEDVLDRLEFKEGMRVLEIGTGNGKLSYPVIEKLGSSGKYYGVDYSEDMIAEARMGLSEALRERCEYMYGDATLLELPTGLDVVYAVNLVYFIDDLKAFFKKLNDSMNTGGQLGLGIRDKETLLKVPMAQYDFHIRELEEITSLLSEVGFKDVETHKQIEPPDFGARQLEIDFDLVNWSIIAKK